MASFGPSARRMKKGSANRRSRLAFDYDNDDAHQDQTPSKTLEMDENVETNAEAESTLSPLPAVDNEHIMVTDGQTVVPKSSSKLSGSSTKKKPLRRLYDEDEDLDETTTDADKIVRPSDIKQKQKSRSLRLSNSRVRSKLGVNLPGLGQSGASLSSSVSYSKSYLDELKSATPTAPITFETPDEESDFLDVAPTAIDEDMTHDIQTYEMNAAMIDDMNIPDEALVSHIIEQRRQRQEHNVKEKENKADEFISLDDDNDSTSAKDEEDSEMEDIERPRDAVFEDDGLDNEYNIIAEGSDGRIPLSASQAASQDHKRRRDIEEAINEYVEDEEDQNKNDYTHADSESESDWENAQIRKGIYSGRSYLDGHRDTRSSALGIDEEPPQVVIQKLPDMDMVVKRLTLLLDDLRVQRDSHLKAIEDLIYQREEITRRESEVKEKLNQPYEYS
ncbi:nineteen complex-related protein 2-domain-containing protein [Dipodascopsis uninucleata]